MSPVSATSASQAAAYYGLQQLRLQQAKRSAEQAEQNALALEAQARSAKQEASQAVENARSLESQSGSARQHAGRVRQGLAAIQTADSMQTQLITTVDSVLANPQLQTSTTVTESPAAAVVNTQGETTGRLVNTTA